MGMTTTQTDTDTALKILALALARTEQASEALAATIPSRHRPSAPLADRLSEAVAGHHVSAQLLVELEPWVALADELDVTGGPIDEVTEDQAQEIIQVAQAHVRRAAFRASESIPDVTDPRDVADMVAALHRRAGAARLIDALAGLGVAHDRATARHLLDDIADQAAAIRAAEETIAKRTGRRDELIRAALSTELRRADIAAAARVKEARLYQIRDGRR